MISIFFVCCLQPAYLSGMLGLNMRIRSISWSLAGQKLVLKTLACSEAHVEHKQTQLRIIDSPSEVIVAAVTHPLGWAVIAAAGTDIVLVEPCRPSTLYESVSQTLNNKN